VISSLGKFVSTQNWWRFFCIAPKSERDLHIERASHSSVTIGLILLLAHTWPGTQRTSFKANRRWGSRDMPVKQRGARAGLASTKTRARARRC
jgi:hypothetical protein